MAENWSAEELEGSVVTYLEMRQKDFDGTQYAKKAYYRELSSRFGSPEPILWNKVHAQLSNLLIDKDKSTSTK